MKHIKIKDPQLQANGPIIEVLISPSATFQKVLQNKKHSLSKGVKKKLLIDTGSSVSAIKLGVA